MLVFAIIAVFVAGLMVGRTPEYLGKKIEAFEMKMASLVILIPPVDGAGRHGVRGRQRSGGLATIYNTQPAAHGFSEVLYAFSSAGNNNGSAFAGLGANTPFYNTALGIAMLFARYWLAMPTLAIAGSLARKKLVPAGAGTLPTHTPLFVVLLIGVVIIVGALTFFPALALGPIVEHLMMVGSRVISDARGTCAAVAPYENRSYLIKRNIMTLETQTNARPLFDRAIVRRAARRRAAQARPAQPGAQPGDVHGRGRRGVLTTVLYLQAR